MKNLSRTKLLLICLSCLPNTVDATTHSNRTFLMPRAPGDQSVLNYATWNHQRSATAKTESGTTFQITTLYQESINKKDLGKYFGIYAPKDGAYRDYIKMVNYEGTGALGAWTGQAQFDSTIGDNTWAEYLVHNVSSAPENFSDNLQFRPTQRRYLVRLDLHHILPNLSTGTDSKAFFACSLPFTTIKNSMGLKRIDNSTPIKIVSVGTSHAATGKTLFDFLKGDVSSTTDTQMLQQPLQKAKITTEKSRTGFADLSTKLGYNLMQKQHSWVAIYLSATIPTGNRPMGEFLFEPLYGNGGHFVLGGGLDAKQRLWKGKHAAIDLTAAANLAYSIKNTEKRTLGIKKNDGTVIPFGYYYALGKQGSEAGVIPCANVTTLDLSVTPGITTEGLFNITLNFNHWAFDFGYNIFAKLKEQVSLKSQWQNDVYAVAHEDYSTDVGFDFNAPDNVDEHVWDGTGHPIQESNLDLANAVTPTQISHTFYAALTTLSHKEKPINLSMGGSYELGNTNADLTNYALWASLSCAF